MAYRGKVLSLDVPKDKLSTIGAGLVFPDATARHFWTEHKIHYSVAVISKKSIKVCVSRSLPYMIRKLEKVAQSKP